MVWIGVVGWVVVVWKMVICLVNEMIIVCVCYDLVLGVML